AVYFGAKAMDHSGKQGTESSSLPALNEEGKAEWADADKNLPSTVFQINGAKDTVIESPNGIILAIPAGTFVDENNTPYSGAVNLDLKEALDPASILKAGLSTKSGDQQLETGGMFSLNAHGGDKQLKIASGKNITAQVPANDAKPGMQLYDGKRKADGTIDWVNPKPLEHFLVPVDILSLNFYPPNYLDTLGGMGYNRKDKKFTDSLYYSFEAEFSGIGYDVEDNKLYESDTIKHNSLSEILWQGESGKGIHPSKIKAIWDKKFQNTLLSTREFEERIPAIHRSCSNQILDLYVSNLGKNLWEIDSMAAQLTHSEDFANFASRKDGKVKIGEKTMQLIQAYYEKKAKLYSDVINKTQQEFWDKQNKLNTIASDKRQANYEKDLAREASNFRNEFKINYKEACRQLGYECDTAPKPAVYTANVTSLGWKNLDKAVLAST
ncbi:MAG TPA: hypothetical protein VNZ86_03385, partial [Bacteroidia bacterium]|nr:hypothetical protein [Bacteroidia bacterium]